MRPEGQLETTPLLTQSPSPGEITARLLDEIQAALVGTNLEAREFALTNLLSELVANNPSAAAKMAESISEEGLHAQMMRRVARLWAAKDPTGALDWAATLADATARDAALTDVCLQVAEVNPASAVQICERFMPDNNIASPPLEALAERWAEKDFSATLAWTQSHPAGEQRDGLMAQMALLEAQSLPREAAVLAVQQMSPGARQDEAVISVVHQWALRDFTAASAWVAQFPEMPLRDRAEGELSGIALYAGSSNTP